MKIVASQNGNIGGRHHTQLDKKSYTKQAAGDNHPSLLGLHTRFWGHQTSRKVPVIMRFTVLGKDRSLKWEKVCGEIPWGTEEGALPQFHLGRATNSTVTLADIAELPPCPNCPRSARMMAWHPISVLRLVEVLTQLLFVLSGYQISWEVYGKNDSRLTHTLNSTTHEYKIKGLSSLTTYTIDVAALTAAGVGLATSSTISSGVPPGQ